MKKMISVLLALIMAFGVCSVVFAENQTSVPEGYIGIYTAEDLYNIRNNLSGKYILMNDIDLSVYENWEPIGTLEEPFTGELDGNGCLIMNLSIIDITEDSDGYIGLFGVVTDAKLANIKIADGCISLTQSEQTPSKVSVGMIAGLSGDSLYNLSGSVATGEIKVTGFEDVSVGGLVAKSEDFYCVYNCVSYVDVSVITQNNTFLVNVAGILAEKNYNKSRNDIHILKCANFGDFYVDNSYCNSGAEIYISGITNHHQASDVLFNCYNRGDIQINNSTGKLIVAGLVGNSCSEAKNSYNAGNIFVSVDEDDEAFAVCGKIDGFPTLQAFEQPNIFYIQNCYYINNALEAYSCDSHNFEKKYVDNVLYLTEEDMKDQSNFDGFDFENVWTMEENGYPVLKNQPKIEISKEIELNVGEVYFIDSQFVEWSTTNPDVATVNENGEITTINSGSSLITAKINYGYTICISVAVNDDSNSKSLLTKLFRCLVGFLKYIKNLFFSWFMCV